MAKQSQNIAYVRNPIYVFYALGAVCLFLFSALLAGRPQVGPLEHAAFNVFYYLPSALTPIFRFITLFGSIGAALGLAGIFLLFRRRDIALRVAAASVFAYFAASQLKDWVIRARPEHLFNYVVPRDAATGSGFPSGHAAVATAVGLTLTLYAPRRFRPWIIAAIFAVCCSRVYLGVHMPLDVIGGYSIGLFFYAAVSLLFGSVYVPVNMKNLVQRLRDNGLTGLELKPASVDARGSVPFFGSYQGGKVFVKVFNRDNNAADWLFKVMRRIQYRRLEDETPSLTSKRAVEHEAYLTMLAKWSAKLRVPELLGVYNLSPGSYAIAMKRLDATGLDKIDATKVTPALLESTWEQINKLHQSHIIHKDLRCANVMIEESTGLPWLIDFGFSEAGVDSSSFYRDNVEFIASSATVVGAASAVKAAEKAIGKQAIADALPYMQYAALSGATTTSLKQNKGLLQEIRSQMQKIAGIAAADVKDSKITRVSKNNLFQIGVILLLFAFLAPQLDSLKQGLELLKTANFAIFGVALLFSVLTYAWAALSYKSLSDIPLPYFRLFIVQWAGSFANRLVPAGIGALGFNTMFMLKNGHNEGKSATIAGTNNFLGVISSLILIGFAILVWSSTVDIAGQFSFSPKTALLIIGGLVILGAILTAIYKRSAGLQSKIKGWWRESLETIKGYTKRPLALLAALGAQLLITLTYTTVMVISAAALATNLSYAQALFAVTMGSLVGSVTPTPGGIGGAEAGIMAALSLVGIATDLAFAIAMLYRLATFWLTIPPGYAAYRYSFAKHYFG